MVALSVAKRTTLCNIQRQLQWLNTEQLFLLSYSTGRTIIWCWVWPVSDS